MAVPTKVGSQRQLSIGAWRSDKDLDGKLKEQAAKVKLLGSASSLHFLWPRKISHPKSRVALRRLLLLVRRACLQPEP